MAFEPIPLKQQVQVEATTAKTFDTMWITKIQIDTPTPTRPADPQFANREGSIYIEYRPMRGGGELHNAAIEIKTEKLWLAASTIPEVAAALSAMRAAARALEDFVSG